ncbi:MFS transporter [Xanthomonas oryzae pv. oryzae]|nr:MFS transporter [Xanthomonas oryzae pv. oryzae]OLK84401.1 MFS transporter [Xanthomonas oryzae pv. oryzae]
MTTSISPDACAGARLPRQIPFIIGNEACERFSFYGMRNILVQFLITWLLLQEISGPGREAEAKHILHSFMIGVYFFPLPGGWLADRFLGNYNTILWFSLVSCAAYACLALFEGSRDGFFLGLGLLALGAGGIKPLVASSMDDRFDQSNKHLAKVVFDAFYWIINFGALFASLLIAPALKNLGPAWAFGIPGILMLVATLVFWPGRKRYVLVLLPPQDPHAGGAAIERGRAQRDGDRAYRRYWAQRRGIFDVLLRGFCVPGGPGLRPVRAPVSHGRQLPYCLRSA